MLHSASAAVICLLVCQRIRAHQGTTVEHVHVTLTSFLHFAMATLHLG